VWIIGFVALCQVICLPGAVLLRLFRIVGLNPFEQIAGVFAASLITNCILVTILGSLGLHVLVIWWLLIAAEVAYLIYSYREKYPAWRFEFSWLRELRTMRAGTAFAGIAFLAIFGIFAFLFYQNWGTVYVSWDDVGNWDRWATEWSRNTLPTRASFYPQLLPTNGSISYVLLGMSDIKMFSKAVAPIYTVVTILLFLSLAIRKRNSVYLFGGAAFGFLVIHYMGLAFPTYGYADLPLTFFGFLAFYCIYRSEGVPSRNEVFAGLLASLGALLTKQGAIYVLAAMLIYAVRWYLEQRKLAHDAGTPAPRFFARDAATLSLAVVATFTAIWYFAKSIQISQGGDFSNLDLLTQGLHQGRSYPERLIAAWTMFVSFRAYTGPFVTTLILVLLLASLFLPRTRPLTLFVLAPFLLLYGLFFSYEIRNALLAFPLAALICAETAYWLIAFIPKPERVSKFIPGVTGIAILTALFTGWLVAGEPGRNGLPGFVIQALTDPWVSAATHLFGLATFAAALITLAIVLVVRIDSGEIELGRLIAVAVLVFVIVGTATNSRAALIDSQSREARATIGLAPVNDRLYAVIAQRNITEGIVTDYWFLRALPSIKQLFRATGCGAPCSPADFRGSIIAYPDAKYVLMADTNLAPATLRMMDTGAGFKTLFDLDNERLIEVDRQEMNRTPEAIGAPAVGYLDQTQGSITISASRDKPIPVSGWAACADPASPIATVEVLVDRKVKASTTVTSMRPGVAHAYGRPDFELSGWETKFSAADVAPGIHELTGRGICKKGESAIFPALKLDITGN
jgi:hypothetical protein